MTPTYPKTPEPMHRGGVSASLSTLLWPLSLPYRAVASWRRRWWRSRATRLSVPVISVGNITCGGTGKTPTVEMVVRDLRERGRKPAILSRGYRADTVEEGASAVNDEYRVLAANLDGVPHFQGASRIESGRRAVAAGADVLVLDDGFQHVRLARDLDLVLLDALRPFDNGRVLPAGLLRESISALEEADCLGITRCELVNDDRLARLREFLDLRFAGTPTIWLESEAVGWRSVRGDESLEVDALDGEPVLALHAVGNPESFRLTLTKRGVELRDDCAFPDHHRYSVGDVERVARRALDAGVETIVMTQKDAVKLQGEELSEVMGRLRWLYLGIRQIVRDGAESYRAALDRALERDEGANSTA